MSVLGEVTWKKKNYTTVNSQRYKFNITFCFCFLRSNFTFYLPSLRFESLLHFEFTRLHFQLNTLQALLYICSGDIIFLTIDIKILQGTLRELSKRTQDHSVTPAEQVCSHIWLHLFIGLVLLCSKWYFHFHHHVNFVPFFLCILNRVKLILKIWTA